MIPIYRAKKIDSDEYVYGFLTWDSEFGVERIIQKEVVGTSRHCIDKSTLAIHFPDMLDSDGNKIFASLSEDGRGGDIFTAGRMHGNYMIVKIQETAVIPYRKWVDSTLENIKVIGVQQ